MVDASLRESTGRQLRLVVRRLTTHPAVAALVGVITGALVQSSSGIVFILVSLVTSGLATVRQVLPIMTWANVGCSSLVFAAIVDLRLAILYLIGVAGAAYAFDRSNRNHVFGAALGVAMLFYGIELMKTGAEPLRGTAWFTGALGGGYHAYLIAFGASTAFSFATQSSVAVSILAI